MNPHQSTEKFTIVPNDLDSISQSSRRTNYQCTTNVEDALATFRERIAHLELAAEEVSLLSRLVCPAPSPEWGSAIILWARALESYGTPSSFFDSGTNVPDTLTIGEEIVPTVSIANKGHALRRDLITAQLPYVAQHDVEAYPTSLHLGDAGCKLCENIAQAYDSQIEGDGSPRRNILLETDAAFVFPNRYPAFPFHSLWIPKSHDDFSERVLGETRSGNQMVLPPELGKTRGRIVSAQNLVEVFTIADDLGLVVGRNHPLDAMSLPAHDHFHLEPEFAFPEGFFDELLAPLEKDAHLQELSSSPFATLVIRGSSREETAMIGAEIMEKLERADQVWTFSYIRGALLITPRRSTEMDNTRIQVGAGISIHHFAASNDFEQVAQFVPRRGEFDWSRYC